jgi:hypothetical protein
MIAFHAAPWLGLISADEAVSTGRLGDATRRMFGQVVRSDEVIE